MTNDLKLVLVQSELQWENPEANRTHIEKLIADQSGDVFLLPETFSTGFSMQVESLAEEMNGPTIRWMSAIAEAKNAAIAGSIIAREDQSYYNRLIWAEPGGVVRYYDKRHRFSFAGEDKYFSAGESRPTWIWRGWRIRPQICYDLRFPVWSRNDDEYDFLFYVANWPAARAKAWRQLLVGRAIENLCYVAGVNRVGLDGKGNGHSGESALIDPLGNHILLADREKEAALTAGISYSELQSFREKYTFLRDRDSFTIS